MNESTVDVAALVTAQSSAWNAADEQRRFRKQSKESTRSKQITTKPEPYDTNESNDAIHSIQSWMQRVLWNNLKITNACPPP
jgi:hypothetical protein